MSRDSKFSQYLSFCFSTFSFDSDNAAESIRSTHSSITLFIAGTAASVPPALLWVGISIGLVALYAVLTEQVLVDEQGIQVTYPRWVPRFFRKGWFLPWSEVKELKPRSTGQGGLVYYFLSQDGKAYLLPMRVAGFARLVQIVQAKTNIDTTDVRPLAQPWMYAILLGFTLLLLLVDGWAIATALTIK